MAHPFSNVLPAAPVETLVIGVTEAVPANLSADTYAMPATAGQLRFWSLDQLNPGNPALNMPLMWKCTGPLDVEALAKAFTHCEARHEALRTTFRLVDGKLSQIIHPPAAVAIPVVDLEPVQGDAHRLEAERLTRDHAAFRFDLKNGPLLTLKLLRFNHRSHMLLVSMHHIICDGISNGILMRDMRVFYESILNGTEPVLPELPIQFADYAVWQEEWLAGPEPAASLDFWHESLGHDFSRLTVKRDEDALDALAEHTEVTGDIETLQVPQNLQDQAHAFCKRENVTLNILLFSIFAALMNRVTGQSDLVIGSPCANRSDETEELIGLFMNIQVMRLRLSDQETFRTLLAKVQQWTLAAVENQTLPFENLVHDPYFSNGSNSFEIPIFFLYQKSFMVTHQVGDLEIVPLRSESPGAVFEMMFAIIDRLEDGPRLQLEYNPRHFKASTIRRYLSMFNCLLESALAAPDSRVDRLALVTAPDRTQLLQHWNRTAVDFGPFTPVANAFLDRTRNHPHLVALECNGVKWTNEDLATYASSLAQSLQQQGVRPGDLVAICVDRSPEMLGAVLAVMMAGAAYVPLDPRHPKERLEMALGDSGAKICLTNRALDLHASATLLDITASFPNADEHWQPVEVHHDSLAYVIYTSGSTGKPKGVAIEHGALRNLLCSMRDEPGLDESDTLVAITTLSFDIAGLELLLPLFVGAKLVIATDAEVGDGRQLLALIERTKATVLQATPGAWRILIDAGLHLDATLKALCGGEAMPRDLAEKLLERTSEVWNVYGPTETTIWSSATRVTTARAAARIGSPIANTQFYILDRQREIVPVGVDGELYIGGAGLARGYWNLPHLTAEKFIPNPFGNGRLYATGDLARRNDDGSIELLGRADFQLKVRGYRIEATEIEAAIMENPMAREAVVMQHPSDSGVTSLVAYVAVGELASESCELLTEQFKTRLLRTLPEYLIPNAFVTLTHLPRNTNGKIDRKVLAMAAKEQVAGWIHSSVNRDNDYVAPQDIIERQLADIWQTTLGIPPYQRSRKLLHARRRLSCSVAADHQDEPRVRHGTGAREFNLGFNHRVDRRTDPDTLCAEHKIIPGSVTAPRHTASVVYRPWCGRQRRQLLRPLNACGCRPARLRHSVAGPGSQSAGSAAPQGYGGALHRRYPQGPAAWTVPPAWLFVRRNRCP